MREHFQVPDPNVVEEMEAPGLLVQPCDCGQPDCHTFSVVLVNPIIRPVVGTTKLAATVQFPVYAGQELVDLIRELCLERGVAVK